MSKTGNTKDLLSAKKFGNNKPSAIFLSGMTEEEAKKSMEEEQNHIEEQAKEETKPVKVEKEEKEEKEEKFQEPDYSYETKSAKKQLLTYPSYIKALERVSKIEGAKTKRKPPSINELINRAIEEFVGKYE